MTCSSDNGQNDNKGERPPSLIAPFNDRHWTPFKENFVIYRKLIHFSVNFKDYNAKKNIAVDSRRMNLTSDLVFCEIFASITKLNNFLSEGIWAVIYRLISI